MKPLAGEFDEWVGRNFRDERERQMLSLAALGDKVGVTSPMLLRYEAGRNRLSLYRAVRMAEALGRPINYFLRGSTLYLNIDSVAQLKRKLKRTNNHAKRR